MYPTYSSPTKTASRSEAPTGFYYGVVKRVTAVTELTHHVDAIVGSSSSAIHLTDAVINRATQNPHYEVYVTVPRLFGSSEYGPIRRAGLLPRVGDNVLVGFLEGRAEELIMLNASGTIDHSELESSGDYTHAEIDNLFGVFHGAILETIDGDVSSNGTTVTFSLEQSGGGDLTLIFSSGRYAFDSTPAATVALTPGSDPSPTQNYIYIPESTKVLTASTTGWPTGEHCPIATVVLQSATKVQADGALKTHFWTDHIASTNEQGHLSHLNYWIRNQHATWLSGATQTLSITTNASTPDNVDFATTAASVLQLHPHAVPAFDTSTGTNVHVVNHPTADYTEVSDLNELLTDSTGTSMSGKYFSLVLWATVSEKEVDSHLFLNLPSGSYISEEEAINDVSGYDNYEIPDAYRGAAFLISRLVLKHSVAGGGTWTSSQEDDLRGVAPGTIGGGGGGTGSTVTTFADNTFEVYDEGDPTKRVMFQLSGITTGNTRTLTVPDDDAVIVGDDTTQTITNKTFGDALDVQTGSDGTAAKLYGSNGAGTRTTIDSNDASNYGSLYVWDEDGGGAYGTLYLGHATGSQGLSIDSSGNIVALSNIQANGDNTLYIGDATNTFARGYFHAIYDEGDTFIIDTSARTLKSTWTVENTLTVSAGGIDVTGNSTIAGTLGVTVTSEPGVTLTRSTTDDMTVAYVNSTYTTYAGMSATGDWAVGPNADLDTNPWFYIDQNGDATFTGDLTVVGSVNYTGGTTFTDDVGIEGQLVVDYTAADAIIVEKETDEERYIQWENAAGTVYARVGVDTNEDLLLGVWDGVSAWRYPLTIDATAPNGMILLSSAGLELSTAAAIAGVLTVGDGTDVGTVIVDGDSTSGAASYVWHEDSVGIGYIGQSSAGSNDLEWRNEIAGGQLILNASNGGTQRNRLVIDGDGSITTYDNAGNAEVTMDGTNLVVNTNIDHDGSSVSLLNGNLTITGTTEINFLTSSGYIDATPSSAAGDLYLRANAAGGTLRTRVFIDGDGPLVLYDTNGDTRGTFTTTGFEVTGTLSASGDYAAGGDVYVGPTGATTTGSVIRNKADSILALVGGTTGTPATLSLYGASHASASYAYMDSTVFTFRDEAGGSTADVNVSGTLDVSGEATVAGLTVDGYATAGLSFSTSNDDIFIETGGASNNIFLRPDGHGDDNGLVDISSTRTQFNDQYVWVEQYVTIGSANAGYVDMGTYSSVGTTNTSGATVIGNNARANQSGDDMRIMQTDAAYGARAIRMADEEGISFHTLDGSVTAGNAFSSKRMQIKEGGDTYVTTELSNAFVVGRDTSYVWPTSTPDVGAQIIYDGGIGEVGLLLAVPDGTQDSHAKLFVDAANNLYGFDHDHTTGGALNFVLSASGTELVRVVSDGKVGIGDNNPPVLLTVDGEALVGTGNQAPTRDTTYGTYDLHVGYQGSSVGTKQRLAIQPTTHTGGPWRFDTEDTVSHAWLNIGFGSSRSITLHNNGGVVIGATPDTGVAPTYEFYVGQVGSAATAWLYSARIYDSLILDAVGAIWFSSFPTDPEIGQIGIYESGSIGDEMMVYLGTDPWTDTGLGPYADVAYGDGWFSLDSVISDERIIDRAITIPKLRVGSFDNLVHNPSFSDTSLIDDDPVFEFTEETGYWTIDNQNGRNLGRCLRYGGTGALSLDLVDASATILSPSLGIADDINLQLLSFPATVHGPTVTGGDIALTTLDASATIHAPYLVRDYVSFYPNGQPSGPPLTGYQAHPHASEGDGFYGRIWARKSSDETASRFRFELMAMDKDGSEVGSVSTGWHEPTTTWETYKVRYDSMPAGTAYLALSVDVEDAGPGPDLYFDDVEVKRAISEAEMVVEGTLEADIIKADSIFTNRLALGGEGDYRVYFGHDVTGDGTNTEGMAISDATGSRDDHSGMWVDTDDTTLYFRLNNNDHFATGNYLTWDSAGTFNIGLASGNSINLNGGLIELKGDGTIEVGSSNEIVIDGPNAKIDVGTSIDIDGTNSKIDVGTGIDLDGAALSGGGAIEIGSGGGLTVGGLAAEANKIIVGTGSNYVTLDGSNGNITASGSASFSGSVSASAGYIGGWTIGTDYLSDTAGLVGMSSAVTGGDDIRFWAGNVTPSSAPFRVTEAGVLTASSGTVGGWTLGTSTLTGGDASLASSGNATFGTSNDVVRLSADDATYRLWIGHATAASAPFSVTKAGAIAATSGSIGGWTLGSTYLYTTTAGMATADYPFYAGDTYANRASAEFRVTTAGALTASNATITGSITATSGAIGNWTIGSTYLYTTTAGMATADYPFYAGDTYANRASAEFRVTTAGALTASNATITGSITSTSGSIGGWTLGSTSLSGTNAVLYSTGTLSLGSSSSTRVELVNSGAINFYDSNNFNGSSLASVYSSPQSILSVYLKPSATYATTGFQVLNTTDTTWPLQILSRYGSYSSIGIGDSFTDVDRIGIYGDTISLRASHNNVAKSGLASGFFGIANSGTGDNFILFSGSGFTNLWFAGVDQTDESFKFATATTATDAFANDVVFSISTTGNVYIPTGPLYVNTIDDFSGGSVKIAATLLPNSDGTNFGSSSLTWGQGFFYSLYDEGGTLRWDMSAGMTVATNISAGGDITATAAASMISTTAGRFRTSAPASGGWARGYELWDSTFSSSLYTFGFYTSTGSLLYSYAGSAYDSTEQRWHSGSGTTIDSKLRVGTTSTAYSWSYPLEVVGGGGGGTVTIYPDGLASKSGATIASDHHLVIDTNLNAGMTLLSGTTGQGYIRFGDSGDAGVAGFQYNHSTDILGFKVGGADRMTLSSSTLDLGTLNMDLTSATASITYNATDYGVVRVTGLSAGSWRQNTYSSARHLKYGIEDYDFDASPFGRARPRQFYFDVDHPEFADVEDIETLRGVQRYGIVLDEVPDEWKHWTSYKGGKAHGFLYDATLASGALLADYLALRTIVVGLREEVRQLKTEARRIENLETRIAALERA